MPQLMATESVAESPPESVSPEPTPGSGLEEGTEAMGDYKVASTPWFITAGAGPAVGFGLGPDPVALTWPSRGTSRRSIYLHRGRSI